MLVFKLSTKDLPRGDEEFYTDTSVFFAGGFDDDIHDILEKFRRFLLVLGYSPATVDMVDINDESK